MPVRITAPYVSLLKARNTVQGEDGEVLYYDHESVQCEQGDVFPDSEVSPVVLEALKSGDEHTCSLMEYVEEKEERTAKKATPASDADAPAKKRAGTRKKRENQ